MFTEGFQSRRLRLQPLAGDARDFAIYRALYTNGDVMRYVANVVPESRLGASFDAAWQESNKQPELANRWTLRTVAEGRDVGLLGAFHDSVKHQVELGVLLLPAGRSQGYATESFRAMEARLAAHGGIERLWSRHAPANTAMAQVLHRCGFLRVDADATAWRWERRIRAALAHASGAL